MRKSVSADDMYIPLQERRERGEGGKEEGRDGGKDEERGREREEWR